MNMYKLKNILHKISSLMNKEINLIDESGYILESTDKERIGEYDYNVKSINSKHSITKFGNYLYYYTGQFYNKNIIFSIKGTDNNTINLAKIIGVFLSEENMNLSKKDFIKDILFTDIEEKELKTLCDRFDLKYSTPYQILLIEINENIEKEMEELVDSIFPDEYLVKITNTTYSFLIHNIDKCEEYTNQIYNAISSELFYEPVIGIGTIVETISNIKESYSKAKLIVDIGKKLIPNKKIYYYSNLTIPILIKNMDQNELKRLNKDMNYRIHEIINDTELLATAEKFFECNLNISDTAKKLFIHRNTLIYRLNKILKITGYDLKNFEDAVNFKTVLLINNYLIK